jgi:hypothetical protein
MLRENSVSPGWTKNAMRIYERLYPTLPLFLFSFRFIRYCLMYDTVVL